MYDIYGKRYANAWLGRTTFPPPALLNLKSSNFLRWFTGVVYYFFGRDLITGFFVFSLITFVGSYMWYRAAAVAIPFLDRKLFFLLMFFAPSIVFWPAGVGKEALVEFGLGGVALGVAYMLNGQLALRTSRVASRGMAHLRRPRPPARAFTRCAGVRVRVRASANPTRPR